ncbi:hypothetical protein [Ideonella sp. B508-1]
MLVKQYEAPRLRRPFNLAARQAAGFAPEELAWLDEDGVTNPVHSTP